MALNPILEKKTTAFHPNQEQLGRHSGKDYSRNISGIQERIFSQP
jgi:hypothetical protein